MCGIAGILNLDTHAHCGLTPADAPAARADPGSGVLFPGPGSPARASGLTAREMPGTGAAGIDPDALRAMAAALAHRGPEDDGFYVDPAQRCGLAFRRLRIIDLEGGHQPLANEDRTVWLVFNGEIYNFRTLRAELEGRGHRFATHTDSEVIVHLYEELGEECFARLHGMFAIALWDQRRGRLLLARDRFGKKPLTYAVFDRRLYFASEAKAILALPHIPRRLDRQSLHRYLLFQYVPAPHSIFQGFAKLPPGHYAILEPNRSGGITTGRAAGLETRPYYRLDPPAFTGTYDDAKARLETLLTSAVEKRLIADVPLGAFLSGGADSSIVVALLRALGVSPLRTFSIGFTDVRYDESAHARRVAAHFQTEHHEHIVTPQAREILDLLAYHYDEPFADSSAIPTYYVSKWTRQSVTVALTGDGGDETFAGYDRYRAAELAARLDALPRPLRGLAGRAALALPRGRAKSAAHRAYRFLSAASKPAARRYLAWVNIFTPEQLAEGYRTEFRRLVDFDEPIHWLEALYHARPGPPADRAARTDLASYLPYDLLTKVDIASMACSLECRAPFLDHGLVEFALSLPLRWRMGKRILKDWARPLLPDGILDRPKAGFGVPVGEWFRSELRDLLQDAVVGGDSICRTIFEPAWLKQFVEAHISGRRNHEHALWALLMLELWHRRWKPAW